MQSCTTAPAERARAATLSNPLEIKPDSELQARIRVGTPEMRPVASTLRVAGRIEADETRQAHVSAPITGRILELDAFPGKYVRQGEALATIHGSELSSAQSAFLKASSQRMVAERAVVRAKHLTEAGVIGSAELQRREAELYQASADVAAAREQLGVLGMDQEGIRKLEGERTLNSRTRVVATINGIILERQVTIGQLVQAVDTLFTIADLSNVWLVADVPEQSAGELTVGRHVEAEIPALPGVKVQGKLSFVSAIVNPETRTVRARMDLPNPRRIFKPAMLATLTMMDGAKSQLVVPSTAVVREDNADQVFVEASPGVFLLKRIELGQESGAWRVVLSGLKPEEKIVTEGAFHLNNERKRRLLGDESGG
jgi:membrane fusion protein, heavy metal efflux system